ncbi:MAG: anhydro-N-acetylmuramic acid kinase [Caulobacterales bacterium]
MRVLGFMTGTSLDAVDMAVLETDGEEILDFGPAGEKKLDPNVLQLVEAAIAAALRWPAGAPEPPEFAVAARAIAAEHVAAASAFMAEHDILPIDLDLIGVQGQTVLHEPPTKDRPAGRTVQLIDAGEVARGIGVATAYDFRSDDVAAGGQGAPLAPVYHAALVRFSGLRPPTAVLNLGGVGNVTLIRSDETLEVFDTGPANGMIDQLVQARTRQRFDLDGALARAGEVHESVVAAYLADPYFARTGPKSLDRFDFSLDPVARLSLEDAAATLTAFAAESVSRGVRTCSEVPLRLIVCGGGRLNPTLLAAIRERLPLPVMTAEEVYWRGDSIEAEAFAYLAARTLLGLPISFPTTTGVPAPMAGGRIVAP